MADGAEYMAFVENLDKEALEYFNNVAQQPFSDQAVAFLNAYWAEVSSQAEFIFTVAYDVMKKADMEAKGIALVHLYEEGKELEFDIALRFYEMLVKFVEDNSEWAGDEYAASQPEMLTALKRKQELREKVDVNFDNRVSFLEYLLYQYKDVANPADFVTRAQSQGEEHPEITKAKEELAKVTAAIQEYEKKKAELEAKAAGTGVKALGAKNELAQLDSSPLMETLNAALITAEAAVRRVNKKFGGAAPTGGGRKSVAAEFSNGGVFWMNRDLEEKQKMYGRKKK